jgi:hypothetical protein
MPLFSARGDGHVDEGLGEPKRGSRLRTAIENLW